MKTKDFQAKLYRETGKFFKMQHLYYLEKIGVFSVPRSSSGRRDYSKVYKEVYENIMKYYNDKYGWASVTSITKGEVSSDNV